jgi:hypothetical protein
VHPVAICQTQNTILHLNSNQMLYIYIYIYIYILCFKLYDVLTNKNSVILMEILFPTTLNLMLLTIVTFVLLMALKVILYAFSFAFSCTYEKVL